MSSFKLSLTIVLPAPLIPDFASMIIESIGSLLQTKGSNPRIDAVG